MKTLFAKILAWFLFATLSVAAAAVLINAYDGARLPSDRMIGIVLRASLDEAAERWRTSGEEGLRAYLEEFERRAGAQLRATDSDGVDLITGEDLSALIARSRSADQPARRVLAPAFTASSTDGLLRGVIDFRPPLLRGVVIRPLNGIVLAVAGLMCWILARHITKPVAELAAAAESFGAESQAELASADRRDEIGDLTRSFKRMAERIRSLLNGQRRLLLDISHEIRSPLARLTIAADLLRTDPTDTESLRQIERETTRINALVSQILDAARSEAGAIPAVRGTVALDDLLREVAEGVRLEAVSKGCEIRVETEAATLTGVEEDLRRAVENVLRNAVRHSPEGGRVDATLKRGEGRAVLSVRDRGSGVAPDALERIFDPFFRSDEARSRAAGGIGLGLTIARRAVEAHGGTIKARNADPGLEVRMIFPLDADSAPNRPGLQVGRDGLDDRQRP